MWISFPPPPSRVVVSAPAAGGYPLSCATAVLDGSRTAGLEDRTAEFRGSRPCCRHRPEAARRGQRSGATWLPDASNRVVAVIPLKGKHFRSSTLFGHEPILVANDNEIARRAAGRHPECGSLVQAWRPTAFQRQPYYILGSLSQVETPPTGLCTGNEAGLGG
jgi:hypothetical protein